MQVESEGRTYSLCFMTPTWGGDLGHFRWLRRSIEKAGLQDVPHRVVVQTEDLELFRPLARNGVQLLSTAEVLPAEIERRRVHEMNLARRGRWVTRLRNSLNKRFQWFPSVRYNGYQIQQITKLQAAAHSPYEITVGLDSDILFARPFDLRLFIPEGHTAVFENPAITPQMSGAQWKWHVTASRLLRQPPAPERRANGYVGTPFVFDRRTALALQQWLESEYGQPWHQVLLSEPLGSWSEHLTYTMFARAYGDSSRLRFTQNPHLHGLTTMEDRLNYEEIIREYMSDPRVLFMNIQSDRRDKGRWPVEFYEALLSRYFGTLNRA